jgi:hypothetical protein
VLRNNGEDTRRERHIEQTVVLRAVRLNLLEVLLQALEGLVLVILTRDVSAELCELFELLLSFFGGSLYVGLDASNVFIVVHLGTGISNNLDILGEELVSVLGICQSKELYLRVKLGHLQDRRAQGTITKQNQPY